MFRGRAGPRLGARCRCGGRGKPSPARYSPSVAGDSSNDAAARLLRPAGLGHCTWLARYWAESATCGRCNIRSAPGRKGVWPAGGGGRGGLRGGAREATRASRRWWRPAAVAVARPRRRRAARERRVPAPRGGVLHAPAKTTSGARERVFRK